MTPLNDHDSSITESKTTKTDKVLDEEFKNSLIKGRNGEQNKEINS